MDTPAPTLDDLRHRLDVIDDRIHDSIMERASVVEGIAALKQSTGQPSFRPGRVAEILRRLMARHHGRFPRQSILRIWCEMLGGGVSMQGPFTVAVAAPDTRPGLWDIARDYFGSHAPMTVLRSGLEVLSAVGDSRATVGVVPMPFDKEDAPWWPALAGARGQGPRVIARLPFADFSNGRNARDVGLVIAAGPADTTNADRVLLVVETRRETSRARLIAALDEIGTAFTYVAAHQMAPPECWHLVEFDGPFSPQDARLASALRPFGEPAPSAWLLGSYARPLPLNAK
jgi:chorismate mutase / prephenate dehydratase